MPDAPVAPSDAAFDLVIELLSADVVIEEAIMLALVDDLYSDHPEALKATRAAVEQP